MTSLPRLLVLTDRSQLQSGRGLRRTLTECADAGLTHVVLRELDLPDDRRAALAGELSGAGLTVIAAHRPLPGCAGVQLPAASHHPVSDALVGHCHTRAEERTPDHIVGRSCHTRAEVAAAAAERATYATLSPYGATASKPGYGPPLGPDAFASHRLAVYALGGITPANAAEAVAAGAHGVAVMGAVMRAAEPAAVVDQLLEALR